MSVFSKRRIFAVFFLAVFGGLGALPQTAHAGAIDTLKQFLDHTTSFSADFSLSVQSEGGRQPVNSNGKLALQKPGKFRWEVQKPYPQLMVGDGQKVWIYDPDLAQVTVRKIDQTLGDSPAALLAGSRDVLKNFELKEAGEAEGLRWVEAQPKKQDSGFAKVRLGFAAKGELRVMQLFDNFGQTTTVRFQVPKINPKLPASQFLFTLPEGVEVLGE
ncbi:MAG: outer membrane lipoprotein chaperone LolA [Zoogloeaceae bacterium]|jgi:outer membrane lipoprotein carrier protein|nr:outer membrane lipoprotein chaperone LolA [Zoogloeaceae bacterium]